MSEPSFTCPKCGTEFNPFAGAEPISKTGKVICPGCGYETPVQPDPNVIAGPILKPQGTKVQENRISDTELGFFITPKGLRIFNVCVSVLGSAFVILFGIGFSGVLLNSPLPEEWGGGKAAMLLVCFLWLFAGFICIGLVYAALDIAYGKYLLYLGPERVRFHHELFGRLKKNKDLVTTRIASVALVERYVRSEKPTGMGTGEKCDIVISSEDGKIVFGGDLTQDERRWICYEIREFVKRYSTIE